MIPITQTKISISHIREKSSIALGVNILIKNPIYIYTNLKQKSTLGKLGKALKMILKKQKSQQQHRDTKMRTICYLAK